MRMRRLIGVIVLMCASAALADKPKAAIFPLGGSATDAQREKVGFALRTKLDRVGIYEVIDGPTMKDLAAAASGPITVGTKADDVKKLAADESPAILLWGELDAAGEKLTLKVKTLDTRSGADGNLEKHINAPTDLRFITEQVLETLPGVPPFEHPSETSVKDDAASAAAFAKNPNLVVDGDFESAQAAGNWNVLLREQKYNPPVQDSPPDVDKAAIIKNPDGSGRVLAFNLSKDVAESNGLACISSAIDIKPNTRYRLQFRYKSDGPNLHVFVKGYSTIDHEERETYRRQVPPAGKTDGKWVTIIDDLNPQHPQHGVEKLRVDLYAYLHPGTVMFDDVVLKEVGEMSHVVKDDAIKDNSPTDKSPADNAPAK